MGGIKINLSISVLLVGSFFLSCQAIRIEPPSENAVLDTGGNSVEPNLLYSVLAAPGFSGGGMTLEERFHFDLCILNVVQDPGKDIGYPVQFLPADPTQDEVLLSTDLNIRSVVITKCMRSNVWQVEHDRVTHRWYLNNTGNLGSSGVATELSWFKIEAGESGGGYKIKYCPTVCKPNCELHLCEEVGVFVEDNMWWLGLGGRKLEVVFTRAVRRA